MDISNEDMDFTLLYLSLFSPISYKEAEERKGEVKLLFAYIVMANLIFFCSFPENYLHLSCHFPFYTTVSEKLKHWIRLDPADSQWDSPA